MRHIVGTFALLSTMLAAPPGHAETLFFVPLQTCTGENCGANIFEGVGLRGGTDSFEQPFVDFRRDSFVAKVFSNAQATRPGCLRVEVLRRLYESDDIAMRLTTPSGLMSWFSDDRPARMGRDPRPLIVAQVREEGWYTLQIARVRGEDPAGNLNFVASYARYPLTNPNCRTLMPPEVRGP